MNVTGPLRPLRLRLLACALCGAVSAVSAADFLNLADGNRLTVSVGLRSFRLLKQ